MKHPIRIDLALQNGNFVIEQLLPESDGLEDKIRGALLICDKHLGAGLYTAETLRTIIRTKHNYFFIISTEGQIIGIFCCYTARFSSAARALESTGKYLESREITGVCRSIALNNDYRSAGLAEYLLNMACDILFFQENAKLVAVPAWIRKDSGAVPADAHLVACGFAPTEMILHPWRKYGEVKCTACNQCPCECDCMLYTKESPKRRAEDG